MYAFARRPVWIVGHLLAVSAVICFVAAGLWQLERHGDRRATNDEIRARAELGTVDFHAITDLPPNDQHYRTVELTGQWLHDDRVTIRNRSLAGQAGCHLVVPLQTDRATVAVTVGWLSERGCAQPPRLAVEETTVTGRVRATQTRGRFGPTDPAEGRLESLARTDVARLDQQVPAQLQPNYLEAITIEPSPPGEIAFLEAPSLDGGPHLGYAMQWFLFTGVVLVGYPLVLRRQARASAPVT